MTSNHSRWRDTRYLDALGLSSPILQAPMAGSNGAALAIAVSSAGGLGSIPAGMLNADQVRQGINDIRAQTDAPFAVNFFCHQTPTSDAAINAQWLQRLAPYYQEFGLNNALPEIVATRFPFDETLYELMVELHPAVVSFHYGLPNPQFVEALKAAGCFIQSTATTVEEARWLEQHGAQAIIAQGAEAGGHRGVFLHTETNNQVHSQIGTLALVPQVVDAVSVPVIATGGIADARGIAASLLLGASAVQLGTRYLFCEQATISAGYRAALEQSSAQDTRVTNVLSGRPARGLHNRLIDELGPISNHAPAFPLATSASAPLRKAAEASGDMGFSPMWSGQAMTVGRNPGSTTDAQALTHELGESTLELLDW